MALLLFLRFVGLEEERDSSETDKVELKNAVSFCKRFSSIARGIGGFSITRWL
jgi:hypothetical protein